ncbi:MAG TPA: nucleoside triphosphate pyrophosphohydrolase [Fimbriimonas sp.]|nr:nucleoside triphosphate pyrophosphohydrolase [Fimbriimonas sp.]
MIVVELSDFKASEFHGRSVYQYDCDCGAVAYPGAATVEQDAVVVVPEGRPLTKLSVVLDLLLGPFGCPWDKEQTHTSLKKYLLEECYEVFDAIDSGEPAAIAEELGDLLLQPLLHARIADKNGSFPFEKPAEAICDKLIRRHPHVFGNVVVEDANEVLQNWDAIKKTEKSEPVSILAGVPKAMPALTRAHEISKRAARAGFEWGDFDGVLDKFAEEATELKEAIASGSKEEVESEIGDLLFTVVNIARWQGVDAEDALRKMLNRFQGRFTHMEASSTKPLRDLSLEEWDALWVQAKHDEA